MKTKFILSFENLSAEKEKEIADWLLVTSYEPDVPFKLFIHKGGVNNKTKTREQKIAERVAYQQASSVN